MQDEVALLSALLQAAVTARGPLLITRHNIGRGDLVAAEASATELVAKLDEIEALVITRMRELNASVHRPPATST
ncbi:hypothetical protein PCAR4_40165 [Paraburkholderia caribensis]|nr:hypothetical protein PCAR4_40165 [Paraburkholderia caribensis]